VDDIERFDTVIYAYGEVGQSRPRSNIGKLQWKIFMRIKNGTCSVADGNAQVAAMLQMKTAATLDVAEVVPNLM